MKRKGSSSPPPLPRELLMEDVHDLKKQQKLEERKEEVYPPPWSDLHESILDVIFCKLSGDDKRVFRSICSSWRQAQEDPTPNFPLPLITYQENTTHAFHSLHGKSRAVDLPETYDTAHICASAFGWLLMLRPATKACFLLNPITRARIDLPAWPSDVCLPSPAAISSSPTKPNCRVFIMLSKAFVACRLDAHKPEWSLTRTGERYRFSFIDENLFEMVGFNGDVYVLTKWGELGVIGGGKKLALTWLIGAPANLFKGRGCYNYLLESSGELLMITRDDLYLAIYKANLDMRRWERIRCLDEDRVLFLGHGSSFSASTAEIGGSRDLIYVLCPTSKEEEYRDKMKVLRQRELVQVTERGFWRKIAASTKVVTVASRHSFWLLRYRHLLRFKK